MQNIINIGKNRISILKIRTSLNHSINLSTVSRTYFRATTNHKLNFNIIKNQVRPFSYTYVDLKKQSKFSPKVISGRSFSNYPNHVVVPMPALSPTMEVGSIASWNLKEGPAAFFLFIFYFFIFKKYLSI